MKKFYLFLLLIPSIVKTQVNAQDSYNDVADLFYTRCTYCHHEGGVAPFSLMTYEDVSSYSVSVYNALQSGTMPPWQPDTGYTTSGKTVPHFLNENTLTAVERTRILDWISDGLLEGDTSNTPKAPIYGDVTYRLNGNADLTLKIPTFNSNASPSNLNPYNCFVLPTNLTEDRWLRAFEIIPGNLEAVHHVVVTIDTLSPPATTNTSGNCLSQPGQFGIGGWTPGSPPIIYPSQDPMKAGVRLPAGARFVLQIHYAPYSDGKVDSTKIRLFFYPKGETGIRQVYANTLLQYWGEDFISNLVTPFLPAGQTAEVIANRNTPKANGATPDQPSGDFTIFSINPHSHGACTKIKNYAYNGTDTIPLISIPNWDFNWEGNYFYPKPIKIPAGYTLESWHKFDNTMNNTHLLSDTRKDIRWGTGTEDEMLFDSFLYLDYQVGDENIDLKDMIEGDTLLIVGEKEIKANNYEIKSYVYPNPSSDVINVYVAKKSNYLATLYNLTGQAIYNSAVFIDKLTIDVKNIPSGVYILEITDTNEGVSSSKKIIITD